MRSGQAFKSSAQIASADLQIGHALGVQSVKTRGVRQHSSVAALLHIENDFSHARLDRGIGIRRPVQAGLEQRLKVSLRRAETQRAGNKIRSRHTQVEAI